MCDYASRAHLYELYKEAVFESKCIAVLSKSFCEPREIFYFNFLSQTKFNQTEVIKYICHRSNSFHGNLFLIHCTMARFPFPQLILNTNVKMLETGSVLVDLSLLTFALHDKTNI